MSTDTAIQLALETLSKIVQESEQIINRKDLVSLFCLRAIPFVSEHPLFKAIRREWLTRRELLNTTAIQADEKAREVYIEAFCEIKKRLEANSKAIEKAVVGHLNLVEQTIAGRAYLTFPFSRAIYDEMHFLLQALLEAGYVDLCRLFCEINSKTTSIVNSEKEFRWFTTIDEKKGHVEISPEEGKILMKQEDPRLFYLPAVDVVEQYHINSCVLATPHMQAYVTGRALSPENYHDPAIVWWFFESALGCWNTPVSYFDGKFKELTNPETNAQNFYDISTKDTWYEIASAKECSVCSQPCIFTNQLFKQGIKTLASSITTYFSKFSTEEAVQKSIEDEVTFELTFGHKDLSDLKNGTLWVSVSTCDRPPQYFYVKKFNHDSSPWRFAKKILQEYATGGLVTVQLGNSESIPKYIARMGLGRELKTIFFGRSESNSILFKGSRVALKRRAISFDDIIKQLTQKHQEAGSPQFQ